MYRYIPQLILEEVFDWFIFRRHKLKDFIDEEAELSGDELERAIYMDEEDEEDDSDSHSMINFVDQAALDDQTGKMQQEVGRFYNRIQDDDDQRRLRFLKVYSISSLNPIYCSNMCDCCLHGLLFVFQYFPFKTAGPLLSASLYR